MKKALKRTLSLMLTVVMLVSCWVFTAPKAVAKDVPPTTYDVRVTWDVTDTGSSFSGTYSYNNTNREANDDWNAVGFTLFYQADNGTGAISHSDKDLKTELGNGTDSSKTFSNIGFPTTLYAYCDHGALFDGAGYDITKIEIAPHGGSFSDIWTGTIHFSTNIYRKWAWINYQGKCKCNDKSNAKVSDSSGTQITKKDNTEYSGAGSWSAPYIDAVHTTHSSDWLWTSKAIENDQTTFTPYTSWAEDNYGVKIATATASHYITKYKGTAQSNVTSVDDIIINSSTGVISANTGGYVAGGSAKHQVYTEVEYTFNGASKKLNDYFTISYPEYTATYKYKTTNTSNPSSPGETEQTTATAYHGDTPTAPTTITTSSYYDASKHYTSTAYNNGALTSNTTFYPNYSGSSHSYTTQSATSTYLKSAATCTAAAVYYKKCSGCAKAGTTTFTSGSALGHNNVECSTAPTNGVANPGTVYYHCTRCDKYFGSHYNTSTSSYEAVESTTYETPSAAQTAVAASEPIPAPAFNNFADSSIAYNYSTRGAGLKIAGSSAVDFTQANALTTIKQGLRFTASMHIPAGVGYTGDNRITDFGYVWSQTGLVNPDTDISNLEIGKTDVQKTSIVANNSGKSLSDIANWTGVSEHSNDGLGGSGKTLTFNLVVNIKAENWKRAYCARAYITYIYNGRTYTVYDDGYSSRTVAQIANAVVANAQETAKVRSFCQTKIVNNLSNVPA